MPIFGTIAVINAINQGTSINWLSWFTFNIDLKIIQNKKNNTPSGLNLAISSAIGEIIIRVDGHCEIPSDYISKCVVLLSKIKADVIGGPINTKPNGKSYIAKGISYVTSHPFGVGNSMFRISKFSGYVDTVPFGAYRRDVFGKIGNFNENLERNQDNELCSRVLESGGRIYMTDELLVNYYNELSLYHHLSSHYKLTSFITCKNPWCRDCSEKYIFCTIT